MMAAEASRGRPRARYGSGGKGDAMLMFRAGGTSRREAKKGVLKDGYGEWRH
jgi:hypothetical protein